MARYIELTKGFKTLVDDEDYAFASKFKWHALTSGGGRQYAARNAKRKCILMHRSLLDPQSHMVIDHINGDSLDNRRCNLRICTQGQNAVNRRDKPPTSGFKGVYQRDSGKYRAFIIHRGVRNSLGEFDDPVEAAKAFNAAALKLRGEYAVLNGV